MRRQVRHRLPMLCVVVVAALSLVAGLLPAEALRRVCATEFAGSDTYRSILGDASNYGIVAQTFILGSGDAQTNVATAKGTSNTQTGNDLTNPVEQPFILATVDGQFRIKGEPAYVRTNAADAQKVYGTGNTVVTLDTSQTADELSAEVGNMLAHGATQSAQLASRVANAEVIYNKDSQKFELSVKGKGPGTFYATIGLDDYAQIANESSKLQIHTDEGQTVVITVPGAADRLQKFNINGAGSDAFLNKDAGNVPKTLVWNFPDATSLEVVGSVTGVVLAPRAAVKVSATSSGWLLAGLVEIGDGEWHNVSQEIEHLRQGSTASFEARKLVNGADASVGGFGFTMELLSPGGWQEVASVQNNGGSVPLGEQTYDHTNYTGEGDVQDFVYRIRETAGNADEAGNQYVADTTIFYAKVTVRRLTQKHPGNVVSTVYAASEPTYYADESCTQPLVGVPTFNNVTSSEPSILVRARKTDKDDPASVLAGATYGLWMKSGNGEDSHVLSTTSDERGMLHFALPTTQTATYYLVEEDAPFGYLVNPLPTDPFTIGKDGESFFLAYADDPESPIVRPAPDSTPMRTIFDYEPTSNPLADKAIDVGIGKYGSSWEFPLSGALLQVVDKESGEVVEEWVSDATEYKVGHALDTGRVYVLREVQAPEGHKIAAEVEFVLNDAGTSTEGKILVGELTAEGDTNATISTNATTGALSISLFNAVVIAPEDGGQIPEKPEAPSGPNDEPDEPEAPSDPNDEPDEPEAPSDPNDEPDEPGKPDNDPDNEPEAPGEPDDDSDEKPQGPTNNSSNNKPADESPSPTRPISSTTQVPSSNASPSLAPLGKGTTSAAKGASASTLVKTGDATSVLPTAILAGTGVAIMALARLRTRAAA